MKIKHENLATKHNGVNIWPNASTMMQVELRSKVK